MEDFMNRKLLCTLVALFGVTAFGDTAQAGTTHTCDVQEVKWFSNRVHVQCVQPAPNFGIKSSPRTVYYFALPMSDAAAAERFAKVATDALAGIGRFMVEYDILSEAGTSFGCATADCRKPTAFGLTR
jgi:hypothetical protein